MFSGKAGVMWRRRPVHAHSHIPRACLPHQISGSVCETVGGQANINDFVLLLPSLVVPGNGLEA